MIKRYLEFIKEQYDSIGEWVESIYQDDDYIKNIVNRFINQTAPDIKLSNAINLLSEYDKNDIKSQIDNYLANGIEDKNAEVLVSTQIDESLDVTNAGKSIFTSFLKTLTALGLKEIGPNVERCPSQFLLFYYYENLSAEDVKSIFSRFKSLSRYLELIDYGKNDTSLYFGLKCDGTLEYGIAYDRLSPIGQFKLSNSVVKWLVSLDSKSASSFKKEIVNLTYNDIILLGKIKMDMKEFKPGYFEKESKAIINDKIITFGYYGVGKWGNGKMDDADYREVKNNFTEWILSKKWGTKVLISAKSQSFWLYLNIKIK